MSTTTTVLIAASALAGLAGLAGSTAADPAATLSPSDTKILLEMAKKRPDMPGYDAKAKTITVTDDDKAHLKRLVDSYTAGDDQGAHQMQSNCKYIPAMTYDVAVLKATPSGQGSIHFETSDGIGRACHMIPGFEQKVKAVHYTLAGIACGKTHFPTMKMEGSTLVIGAAIEDCYDSSDATRDFLLAWAKHK